MRTFALLHKAPYTEELDAPFSTALLRITNTSFNLLRMTLHNGLTQWGLLCWHAIFFYGSWRASKPAWRSVYRAELTILGTLFLAPCIMKRIV